MVMNIKLRDCDNSSLVSFFENKIMLGQVNIVQGSYSKMGRKNGARRERGKRDDFIFPVASD